MDMLTPSDAGQLLQTIETWSIALPNVFLPGSERESRAESGRWVFIQYPNRELRRRFREATSFLREPSVGRSRASDVERRETRSLATPISVPDRVNQPHRARMLSSTANCKLNRRSPLLEARRHTDMTGTRLERIVEYGGIDERENEPVERAGIARLPLSTPSTPMIAIYVTQLVIGRQFWPV